MKPRSAVPILFLFALILAACGGQATPVVPAEPVVTEAPVATEVTESLPPILVGMNIPYTGGDPEGAQALMGWELYVDDLNARGGVLGRQIELIIGDNQCDSAVGVGSIRRLIEVDNVDVVYGSMCSSVTLAVMPIIEEAKIVHYDGNSGNVGITEKAGVGGNIWQFRFNLNDELMTREFAPRVIAKDVKTLSMMTVATDYGRGVAEVVRDVIGDIVVSEEYFAYGDADFRTQLTKIKSLNPEGILILGDSAEAAKIITQMYELGMTQKIFGRGTVVTQPTLDLLAPEVLPLMEGAKEVTFFAPNPDFQPVMDAFEARYGEPLTRDHGMGYFAAQVLEQAIINCGKITGDKAVDRACIRDGMEALDMDLVGLGHIKFDDHHQSHYDMFITEVVDGKVQITARVPTE